MAETRAELTEIKVDALACSLDEDKEDGDSYNPNSNDALACSLDNATRETHTRRKQHE